LLLRAQPGGLSAPAVGLVWWAGNVILGVVPFGLSTSLMSKDEADRFRKQAEECREQAAKALSPLDKEAWLRVAEEWLKLALSADGQP